MVFEPSPRRTTMNPVAAFGWSLLTVYLAGLAVTFDPGWFVELSIWARGVVVFIWLLFMAALASGGNRRSGWGLAFSVVLVGNAVLVYAVGALITLNVGWFTDVSEWWRLTAASMAGLMAVGSLSALEGIDFFG